MTDIIDIPNTTSYMIITRNKSKTYPIITQIPQLANAARGQLYGNINIINQNILYNTNILQKNVKITNKDNEILDIIMNATHKLNADSDILYYQMLYQIINKKYILQVNSRSLIITQSLIFLCNESLMTYNVNLIIIDNYLLKDIYKIKIIENINYIKITFKSSNLFIKRKKWRLRCDNINNAMKLYEECKRLANEQGNYDL